MDHDTFVNLQIWDTAGQERFKSVTTSYYRDAHGTVADILVATWNNCLCPSFTALLLLYDVTNPESFINTRQWLSELRDYSNEDIIILLLGNKADCDSEERQVKPEGGQRMAQEYHVGFLETSAKSGLNINLVFESIARSV